MEVTCCMAKASVLNKKRMIGLLMVFGVFIAYLLGNIFKWQIVKGAELKEASYNQQTKNRTISPKRGVIYDRNGTVLAESVSVETISITPKNISSGDKERTAHGLSEILNLDYDTVLAKTKKNSADEIIAKKLEKEVTDKVRTWIAEEKIKGVNIYEDTKRYYPNGSFLSHVLGFCGVDNQGLEGLEIQYENVLKGVPGKLVIGIDGVGKELPLNDEKYIPPEDGLNLVLTIDEVIQYIVEKYLDQALIDYGPADYVSCIVMEPKTGEILAMAVSPDYDPNNPFTHTDQTILSKWDDMSSSDRTKALQTLWRNRTITDATEPGSVFKTITSAIAIEEGVVTDVDKVAYTCTGSVNIEGWPIRCWRSYNPHGAQSFRKGLMNSCNPVFIGVSLKIGKTAFYNYLSALGISKKTGVDLPGEVNGIIHKISDVSDSTIASASFGQGFTLTQLNMINAISSIANGGNLMKPHIVKKIIDKDGNTIQENEPTILKQVFSKETSEKVLDMMESVVSQGTGKNAKVDGYYIAGKTSTSEQGRGENTQYSASFAALVPADDPQVAVLYTIYNPKGKLGHQGGSVAAPVVQNILSELLEYMEIPKSYETKDTIKKVTIPDVSNRTVGEAIRMLNSVGLKYDVDTSDLNAIVVSQMPIKGETVNEKSLVKLYLQGNDTRFNTTVPNVLNLDIVSATKKLSDNKLNIKISGSGMSVLQSPTAGTNVEQGTVVRVEFRPVGLDVE